MTSHVREVFPDNCLPVILTLKIFYEHAYDTVWYCTTAAHNIAQDIDSESFPSHPDNNHSSHVAYWSYWRGLPNGTTKQKLKTAALQHLYTIPMIQLENVSLRLPNLCIKIIGRKNVVRSSYKGKKWLIWLHEMVASQFRHHRFPP